MIPQSHDVTDGRGGDGSVVGLSDLGGLLQPQPFRDFMSETTIPQLHSTIPRADERTVVAMGRRGRW